MQTLPAPTVTRPEALAAELERLRSELAATRKARDEAELRATTLAKVLEMANGIIGLRDLMYGVGDDVAALVKRLGCDRPGAREPLPRTGISPLRLVRDSAS